MVYRVYVEKKTGLDHEAQTLLDECVRLLGIDRLTGVRLLNRYDAEDIDKALFDRCRMTVFGEPQLDDVTDDFDPKGGVVFATEYLPGQFDQRADSAAQCIQLISMGDRPLVRTAKVYVLSGDLTDSDVEAVKKYVINPVESREAALEKPETLRMVYDVPTDVPTLTGFIDCDDETLTAMVKRYALAMDADDLAVCRDYFREEGRDPTLTELRMLDTYWSDHCRHTTFTTVIDSVTFADARIRASYEKYLAAREALGTKKPQTLMDVATVAAKYLKRQGKLDKLDESEEINACTVKITVTVDGEAQDWLLLFKNETHNHPTEIEPFGGAATCIGGAIRDPLSGRSYVYAAMRVTGAADPTVPIADTLPGKLPQRKIVTTAAQGYSSYGNQIGLATGIVDEVYHPGYAAKHLEIGAVIGAAPRKNVRRETPQPGDPVILLGGRTGRDGCGGATGSSKSHTAQSLETCGAEVQKGNAPEERKLQRLFRSEEAARMIKRCNDFGAGGVSVAIGELADGLDIDLDAVPKKYDGLDGTELAISESQERMAVVVDKGDEDRFIALAAQENLEATVVAVVTQEPRLRMRWRGKTIVDVRRDFLNSAGAVKHIDIAPEKAKPVERASEGSFRDRFETLVSDLNVCSKKGLAERFDSTIGAGSVFMPFGGRYQRTPAQAMVTKLPVDGHTDDCSFMAWGFDPDVSEKSPYHGAYLAVVHSVSKLIAAGASREDVWLTFQEYFEKPGRDPARWGKPLAALLGAFEAQMQLGMAAIGGKDSMSGSFEDLDVPPTLVSFAVTMGKTGDVISPEFKAAGHRVALLAPDYDEEGLPETQSLLDVFDRVTRLAREGKILACWPVGEKSAAEGVFKACIGNGLGFRYADGAEPFAGHVGAFLLELAPDAPLTGRLIGETTDDAQIVCGGEALSLDALLDLYEGKLASVYPRIVKTDVNETAFTWTEKAPIAPAVSAARPQVLIPVFPGTNCEYDTAKAFEDAGAKAKLFVVNNMTPEGVAKSAADFAKLVDDSQIVFIPGGFSGGDEPDGSGKFITAFFRGAVVADAVTRLLDERGGLMGGICNGFQALIKLGLVPYGRIIETGPNDPTLTFNTIGRHQSAIVRVRVASSLSPWFAETKPGEIYSVPISHGEGRFRAGDDVIRALAAKGQIATQYVDLAGSVTANIDFNPNQSAFAVEGITSPDGRVFGKMGHAERIGDGLYQNVPGNYDMGLFRSAVKFFRGA